MADKGDIALTVLSEMNNTMSGFVLRETVVGCRVLVETR